MYGHEVVTEHHGVTEDAMRYFGVLSLRSTYTGYEDMVALRNSEQEQAVRWSRNRDNRWASRLEFPDFCRDCGNGNREAAMIAVCRVDEMRSAATHGRFPLRYRQRAIVLAAVKDKPFGWPRKVRPSLTATRHDGAVELRSGRKNARGAGRTKEWAPHGQKAGHGRSSGRKPES
jgi:hypothetical protein